MLFNSLSFLIFLPIVFLSYWIILKDNLRLQNIFLVIVSYIFYAWWDWRFLFLIAVSSFTDYFIGLSLKNTSIKFHKSLLLFSILTKLSILIFFK